MPVAMVLVSVGQAEHHAVGSGGAGDLHADGKTGFRKAAVDGDRRQSVDVERTSVAEHK